MQGRVGVIGVPRLLEVDLKRKECAPNRAWCVEKAERRERAGQHQVIALGGSHARRRHAGKDEKSESFHRSPPLDRRPTAALFSRLKMANATSRSDPRPCRLTV